MYRILQQGPRLIVASPDDDLNAIRLDDLSALLRLRQRIEQYLLDQQPDAVLSEESGGILTHTGEYIDTVEARRIAEEQGARLPKSTIVSACANGSISGVVKEGGRWMIPAASFYRWLNRRDRSA